MPVRSKKAATRQPRTARKKRGAAAAERAAAEAAARRAESRRKAAARASREDSQELREIGELPDVVNPERRERCRKNLELFATTYFPRRFKAPFCAAHRELLAALQNNILRGGLKAVALPRGYGKSTIAAVAVLWALLYGYRRYVALIGATGPLAKKILAGLKKELQFNALLAEDFPEVCFPVRELKGIAQRTKGQTYRGEPTNITIGSARVVLPTIAGSAASGALIDADGLLAAVRGLQYVNDEGEVLRPDLAVIDDPQTRRSAKSKGQTDTREQLLTGDLLYMAGHDTPIAAVCCCTVIYADDLAARLTDRKRNPEWQGQREKMLITFPKRMDLWDRYAQIRQAELVERGTGEEATAYYEQHRKAMDAGSKLSWTHCYAPKTERSALQHALNLYFRDPASFACEAQNSPEEEKVEDDLLPAPAIAAKVSEYPRLIVPPAAQCVTAFVDVHKRLLYWVVAAFADYFTGWAVAYGTWPSQPDGYFQLATCARTIQQALPELGTLEAQILQALRELAAELKALPLRRPDNTPSPIDLLGVDANWGDGTDAVYAFAASSPIATIPSHGRYYGARHQPLQFQAAKQGELRGANWKIPPILAHRQCRHVVWDTNRWKTAWHRGIARPNGTPGAFYLHAPSPDGPSQPHRLIAEHARAEFKVQTSGPAGFVDEWALKTGEDNHFFDCLVGSMVMASIRGVRAEGQAAAAGPARPPRRQRAVRF